MSGTYKTTELGKLALWFYETTGKPTRMIHCDIGGVEHIRHLIDAGIIELQLLGQARNPIPLLNALGKGYWRPIVRDQNGNFRLTPPGGEAGGIKNDLSRVACYMVEGITSISERLMRDLQEKNRLMGSDADRINPFSEPSCRADAIGDEQYSGTSRSYYGGIHGFVKGLLQDLAGLQLVPHCVITAHEAKGKDDLTNEMVLGPASVGKAQTARLPKDLGDMFHMERVMVPGPVVKAEDGTERETPPRPEVRAYFVPHVDAETRMLWPATLRVSPLPMFADPSGSVLTSNRAKVLAQFPKGYIVISPERDKGLVEYFQLRHKLFSDGVADARDWKRRIDERFAREREAREASAQPEPPKPEPEPPSDSPSTTQTQTQTQTPTPTTKA